MSSNAQKAKPLAVELLNSFLEYNYFNEQFQY